MLYAVGTVTAILASDHAALNVNFGDEGAVPVFVTETGVLTPDRTETVAVLVLSVVPYQRGSGASNCS